MAGQCQPVNMRAELVGACVALRVSNSCGCSWRWEAALHVPVGSAKAQGAAAAGTITQEGLLEREEPLGMSHVQLNHPDSTGAVEGTSLPHLLPPEQFFFHFWLAPSHLPQLFSLFPVVMGTFTTAVKSYY